MTDQYRWLEKTDDPAVRHSGALLPLGGFGTENGGHKGYGLGALSEILTGVLAGGWFGAALTMTESPTAPSGITSHFFGAIRVDAMRDIADMSGRVGWPSPFHNSRGRLPARQCASISSRVLPLVSGSRNAATRK